METKTCPRCKNIFPLNNSYFKFRVRGKFKGDNTVIPTICLSCYKEYNYERYHNNKERIKIYRNRYRVKCKSKIDVTLKKYRETNKDKLKIWAKTSYERQKTSEARLKRKIKDRSNLSDNYIKSLITKRSNIKRKDIPPILIEAWRIKIQLDRLNYQKQIS